MTWNTHHLTTPRGTFEVFTKGTGQPLCVTHHYSSFNESGDYFAEAFTDQFTVYLVNLKGTGHTSAPAAEHELSMVDAVYDLESIRETLGFSTWHFAGHSTGGMIGLLYGIYFSPSLTSLTLVSTAARNYMDETSACIYHREHPQFQYMQSLIEALKVPERSTEERTHLAQERTKLSLYRPELYENYFSLPITKTMAVSRMNFFAREMLIYDITRQLYKITTPTHVMCGRHDVQCPLLFSEEISAGIPGSTFTTFEESNHYPFLEEKDAFSRAISTLMHS
ncbi:prolyl aminopeptidase [Fictibacillus macauensis ZFHKF-1]|uniref:Prolyl aminopeptidase n=1 Tax=Fictibacillus macauensis ZFHKF-1 TaxID=1196324 RepID=I8UBP3_9BACL|nr:alpha/beta hydrolase [Fictibacillus macauensis]EIT84218.1 prolyl aminopeptidase [Fictibacillus macauensis ZFHKF-1]